MLEINQNANGAIISKEYLALILLHFLLLFHSINGKSTTSFSRRVCTSALDSTETLNHKQLKTLWFVEKNFLHKISHTFFFLSGCTKFVSKGLELNYSFDDSGLVPKCHLADYLIKLKSDLSRKYNSLSLDQL